MGADHHQHVKVPGGRIHTTRTGAGPDLVLLNAGSMDLRMWEPNLPTLTARHRVTRYDDRGVGHHSSRATEPWSCTADLLAVLDAWGIPRATLVGSSDGGRKALDFAVQHPDRVDRLVLVGCALHLPDPDPVERAAMDALLNALAPRSEAVARGDLAAAITADLDVWAARATPAQRAWLARIYAGSPDFLLGHPAEPLEPARPAITHLTEVQAPTLILVGEHDTPYTHRCAARISAGVPDARRRVVEGADHFINLTRPDLFHAHVLSPSPSTDRPLSA
ncbi:alpha/beta fold hydrolase [Kitasatospora sp. NPDC049258]|uniref:alpha/beta fold hydrolase n=1 Tax=Kitasatospora sp. NPDC049258 TaxID=3155394 RepID=UPI00341D8E1D